MDIRKVKKLIELLEESNIDELEIKEGEESVRITRNTGITMAPQMMAPMAHVPAPVAAAPAAAEPVAPAAAGHSVKSPMVGTFYRSPSPEAASFVEVAKRLKLAKLSVSLKP